MNILSLFTKEVRGQDQLCPLDVLLNISLSVPFSVKHCVCTHKMSCVLEINSVAGLKQKHLESCFSATKNIMPPLPQWLKPLQLAGW